MEVRGYVAPSIFLSSMFGTIRRHKNWLWYVIIVVIIISFVYYFNPSQRGGRNRGGGTAKALEINGKVVTPKMIRDSEHEVRLLYYLNFRKWPEQDAERAQQINFDLENEAYLRMFRVSKAEEAGVQIGDITVAEFAHRLLGDFPLDKFAKEVLEPNGLTADDFERFVRNDAAIQQLSAVVGAAGRLVTPAEAEALYRRDHQELGGDIVYFNISNYLSKVVITNGALTNWYSQQVARYRTPEKVSVSYVEFPRTNFTAEADQHFGTLTNLEIQLREIYVKSGGTNSFKDTNGVPLSESAALAKIKEDQRDRLALMMAGRKANEFANKVYDAVKAREEKKEPVSASLLDAVAATENLKVQISRPFDAEDGPTNLDVSPRFAKIAFALHATNNPISFQPIEGEHGVYIIALKEAIPGRFEPYEAVASRVADDYKRYNAYTQARQAGMDFIAVATNSLAAGKTFSEIAQQMKLTVETLPPISPATESLTNLEEHVNVRQLKSIMFSLEPGRMSQYTVNPPEGGYVVYVRAKLPFDEATLREQLPKFTSELRYQKQNEIFGQWFRRQVEKANLPLNNRPKRPSAG